MMNKAVKGLIFLGICLLIVGFFFKCQIKTYFYSKDTTEIREQLETMGCSTDSRENVSLLIECDVLIEKHNRLVREWNKLSCITMPLDNISSKTNSGNQLNYSIE